MKKIIFLFATMIATASFCQDKQSTIDFKGRAKVASYIDLGDAGVLLHEAWDKIANKHPGAIHHYSAKGDLVWKKEITNFPGSSFITASPDGSIVYYGVLKGSISLTQIKSNGSMTEKDLPDSKAIQKNLTTVFCDKSYLYFLNTLNGDQYSDKKRGADKLIVHRISHSDFAYKQFTLALPAINSENTSFWKFIGQKNDKKYLVSKEIDPKAGTIRLSIVDFNAEGVIGKQVTINQTIAPDVELVEPSRNRRAEKDFVIVLNMDEQELGSVPAATLPSDLTGPNYRSFVAKTNGRYAAVTFDPVQAQFHVLMLTKEKSSKKFFDLNYNLSQFSLTGDLLWKNTLSQLGNQFYAIDYILPKGNINITTFGDLGITCTEVSRADGKTVATQKFGYGMSMNFLINMATAPITILRDGKILKSAKYVMDNIPEADRKAASFQNFTSSAGEILVLTPKKGETSVLYFANQ